MAVVVFSAAGRRGPGKPGHPVARPLNPGDKHVLGQFFSRVFIYRLVHGKPVIAFFEQQGVAGIGAFETVGGLVLAGP